MTNRETLLRCLYRYMADRRLSTAMCVKLFNKRDKSEDRKALRSAWMELEGGDPDVNSMARMLKSCAGTIFLVGVDGYTLREVPRTGMSVVESVWEFGLASTGAEAFLRALRERIGDRWLRFTELWDVIRQDEVLEDLAASCTRRYEPLTERQMVYMVRYLKMKKVDGYWFTKSPTERWGFVRMVS